MHFKSATIIAITMLAQGGPAGTQFGIASGEWQVTEVLVDRQATRTLGYGPNDPRLRYRIATIGAGRVTFDSPERAVCEQPAWSEDEISIGALWRSSFGGRGTAPEWPTAQDYGLSIAIDQKVSRVSVHCKDGGFGPLAGNEPSTWFIRLSDGRIALRWYDQSVLILRKLSKEDKPEASFDCTKAPSATERAVCSSHTLAGLDRSMSEAYAVALRNAKKIDPAKGKEMAATQRAWLHTRDDCLGDVRCLDRVMRQRVDVLADVPG